MKLRIPLISIALALLSSSCWSNKSSSLSPATLNAGLAQTNRVGAAIFGGNQVNSLLGSDGAFSEWRDVAKIAAESGTEFSLVLVGHGASKQPDIKRESTTEKKAQDAFVSALGKAAAGDKSGAVSDLAEAATGIIGVAAEAANPPSADDTSLVAAHAAIGPGANLAGVAAAAELRMTRVEAIKAARSNYNVITKITEENITTKDGLETVQSLAPYMVEAYKAHLESKLPVTAPGGALVPSASTPGTAPVSGATGPEGESSGNAYIDANYPGIRLGGSNDQPPSETSLWKPISDSNGNLVVILPHSKLGVIKSVTIDGEQQSVESIGNAWRPHVRFSKTGSAYSGKIKVSTSTGTYEGQVPNPGQRTSPIPLNKIPTTINASDLLDATKDIEHLYDATPNTLTLRSDFASVVSKVDALHTDGTTAIPATRSGNTWTIAQPLADYPHGPEGGSNTWRIRLTGTPPAGVTYHTSMMQTFVTEENIAEGKQRTYPPTTRY